MPTPMQAGDALHNAVSAIERHILATSPSLTKSTFVIEEKKVVIVNGVRHEIDICVTVNVAPGYDAVYIFECKNWKNAVGKTEILDFSAKVEDLNAAQGYFVAKSFTRYARAQARQDGRIKLLTAAEHDALESPAPLGFHAIIVETTHIDITLNKPHCSDGNYRSFDPATAEFRLQEKVQPMQDYIRTWADETRDADVSHFASGLLPEGRYSREATSTRNFAVGECVVNGQDVEVATIVVHYYVDLFRPRVVSYFAVETRGRCCSLAPISLPGEQRGQITVRLVAGWS